VDRRSVGKLQSIKLPEIECRFGLPEHRRQLTFTVIDAGDDTKVTIVDVALTVIDDMHHLVARTVALAKALDELVRW